MTDREIWIKYGPDALHAGAEEIRGLVNTSEIHAALMKRFGRSFAEVLPVLREINSWRKVK